MTTPPLYWQLLLTRFLKADGKLAAELWHTLGQRWPWKVPTLTFALDRMLIPTTLDAAYQRLSHFEQVLPAKDLFVLTLRLAPEGTRRRPDIVRLEETILGYMSVDGQWR